MIRRLAAFSLLAALFLGANTVDAATFRIQGATYADDGTFSDSNGTFRISGEFSILTDYLNADGTQNPQLNNVIQSWNIVIKNTSGNILDRYVSGYSQPVMGGLANNSQPVENGGNYIYLTCNTSGSGCSNGDQFAFELDLKFYQILRNSYEPNGVLGSSVAKTVFYKGVMYRSSADQVAAQADFVPIHAGLIALFPVLSTFTILKSRSNLFRKHY